MIKPANKPRVAFTLIELLVVIAIIAVLAGLILAGVMAVRTKQFDTGNSSDINQMNVALQTFKSKFGCYPPSRIRLLESGAYSTTSALDVNSVWYLKQIWPRIALSGGIDWNNDGNTAGDWTLEGDQCLVFFLGGIPSGGGVIGFSASPTNPTAPPAANQTRINSFYNFETSRLAVLPQHAGSPFPSYLDRYKTPFAYFSTFKQSNQYNPYFVAPTPVSDCNAIGAMPYCKPFANNSTVVQYYNPDSFQIISAGSDTKFGSTTAAGPVIWNPAASGVAFNLMSPAGNAAGPPVPQPYAGMDDRTNFSPNILSAGTAQ